MRLVKPQLVRRPPTKEAEFFVFTTLCPLSHLKLHFKPFEPLVTILGKPEKSHFNGSLAYFKRLK